MNCCICRGAHTAESLRAAMASAGFAQTQIEQVEPTLEDVFIALAGHGAEEQSSTDKQ